LPVSCRPVIVRHARGLPASPQSGDNLKWVESPEDASSARLDCALHARANQRLMPLEYEIDSVKQIVTITGDYAEPGAWRTLLQQIRNDPRYRRGSSFVRDLRGSEHPVDATAVMGIIGVVKEHWSALGAHRAAIVMSSGDDAPALIAHALADFQHLPLRAFTSYDDAINWLHEKPTRV
jgi:hypothetical protein